MSHDHFKEQCTKNIKNIIENINIPPMLSPIVGTGMNQLYGWIDEEPEQFKETLIKLKSNIDEMLESYDN